jgi:hypothetical protein
VLHLDHKAWIGLARGAWDKAPSLPNTLRSLEPSELLRLIG